MTGRERIHTGDAGDVVIRRALAADAKRLAELAVRTFRETYTGPSRPDDVESYVAAHFGPDRQRAELEDPAMTTLLAVVGGTLSGYAQLRCGPRDSAPPGLDAGHPVELARFYVDRPWQGRGVAAALMEACLTSAHALGGDALWLSVWERNPRAVAFYGKHGFRAEGTLEFTMGTDVQRDWLMVRRG